jgi:hypothetical protein
VFTDPLDGALLQAARPMAAATAPSVNSVTKCEMDRRTGLRAAPIPCPGLVALAVSRRAIRPPPILDNLTQRPGSAAYRLAGGLSG